jgi:NADH-quinone oxidoreductase subunit H
MAYVMAAAFFSLLERRLIGRVQRRVGPNYHGIFGILQPIADIIKLLSKRDFMIGHQKVSIFSVFLMVIPIFVSLSIIPFSREAYLINPRRGILVLILMHSIKAFFEVVIGITSRSKYGCIGGIRAFLQMVASNLPYVLCMIALALKAKSLHIMKICVSNTFSIYMLPLVIVFFIVILMQSNRQPFDFVDAESEIVSGAYVEYGGILFGMIYLSDYLNLILNSLIISVMWLGGFDSGFLSLSAPAVTAIKALLIAMLIIIIRALMHRYTQRSAIIISTCCLAPICLLYITWYM